MDAAIVRLARHYARGPARNDADDLAQEARVAVWLHGPADHRLLLAVARRTMIDALRRWYGRHPTADGNRRWRGSRPDRLDEPLPGGETPAQLLAEPTCLEDRVAARLVLTVIDGLPGRERAAVLAPVQDGARPLAARWGVHESRVCQIRRDVLADVA